MRFHYELQGVCGTVYTRGAVAFAPPAATGPQQQQQQQQQLTATASSDAASGEISSSNSSSNVAMPPDALFSPIGNRVQRFALALDEARTLPFECSADIVHIAVSPRGDALLAIDVTGAAVLSSLRAGGRPLAFFNFKGSVTCVAFSPTGEFIAVGFGGGRHQVQVWRAPPLTKEFAPFVLFRTFTGHFGDITCVNWSADGKFLVTGSADMTARVFSLRPPRGGVSHARMKRRQPPATTLAGHRDAIVGCFFSERGDTCFTISHDNALYVWKLYDAEPESVEGDDTAPAPQQDGDDSDSSSDDSSSENSRSDASSSDENSSGNEDGDGDTEMRGTGESEGNKTGGRGAHTRRQAQRQRERAFGRRWRLEGKHFMNNSKTRVVSAQCHRRQHGTAEVDVGGPGTTAKHTRTTAASQANSVMLVVGFDDGSFGLYSAGVDALAAISSRHARERSGRNDGARLGTSNGGDSYCDELHTLSISRQRITACSISSNGKWLAFGCAALGQLLVWEWESETYVLKQQGHTAGGASGLSCTRYSRDGQWVATGGDDGAVKVWNSRNGFSLVTFREHKSGVSGLAFGGLRTATLYSSSKDGTVRAFDLRRYRNFRTFSPPRPCELLCLAVDTSGELVVAGGGPDSDFSVYVWSVLTGRLLDTLRAHEGPVSSLEFCPNAATLASCSWDGTVRVWDVFEGRPKVEPFRHSLAPARRGKSQVASAAIEPVLCVAWSPSGEVVCSAGRDGQLNFWDADEGNVVVTIDVRKDLVGGRAEGDAKSVESQLRSVNSGQQYYVDTVCYSPDGTCVLASGNSRFVCCYYIPQRLLVRRFSVSSNRSLGGVVDLLNSRALTEAGTSLSAIDDDPDSGAAGLSNTVGAGLGVGGVERGRGQSARGRTRAEDDSEFAMPGAAQQKYQMPDKRRSAQVIRCHGCDFAPSARSFCVATTEGLLLYSLDNTAVFDPVDLDEESTPENCRASADRGDSLRALVMAFRLNDDSLIEYALLTMRSSDLPVLCRELPDVYVVPHLRFLSKWLERTHRMEFALRLTRHTLFSKGAYLSDNVNGSSRAALQLLPALRHLYRSVARVYEDTAPSISEVQHTLEYLTRVGGSSLSPSKEPIASGSRSRGGSAKAAWARYAQLQREKVANVGGAAARTHAGGTAPALTVAPSGGDTSGALPGWGDFDDDWGAELPQTSSGSAGGDVVAATADTKKSASKKKRKRSATRSQVPTSF